jgi:two-component system sensor histidine kinase KdpD
MSDSPSAFKENPEAHVGSADEQEKPASAPSPSRSSVRHYVWTLASVIAVTIVGQFLQPVFDPINIALLYLLPVLISAVRWGRGPSLLASFLGVLAFDLFFVSPVGSLTVSDARYVLTFAIFLLVALVTSTMATRLLKQAEEARGRERRTAALHSLSHKIATETNLEGVLQTVVDTVAHAIAGQAAILLPGPFGSRLTTAAHTLHSSAGLSEKEEAVARWVFEHRRPAGRGTSVLGGHDQFFFPVCTTEKSCAVFALQFGPDQALSSEQVDILEALADLAALAITRVRLAQEAERAKWLAESEKLHSALLNSISHDLRTPLASITGAVTSLLSEESVHNQETRETLLLTIKEEAARLNHFVANLLDMVRLESGILKLNKEWCDIQDILGVVLRGLKGILEGHPLRVNIPPGLPLVKADFALIEHVMANLLENAAKYSPPQSEISVSAHYSDEALLVTITDLSSSIPKSERENVFKKFYRMRHSKDTSGTGLGLSICRGIVEAHGGKIWVEPSFGYGNEFTFSLPLTEQPPEKLDTEEGLDHAV